MEIKKIQNFKDLKAWQEGHRLVISVYKITKAFISQPNLHSPISILFLILFSIFYSLFSTPPAYASTINAPSNYLILNTGLVGWWTFDGPKMVSNVADSSGSGNNGYLKGQVSTTTTPGKVGQALQLDGVDDYVDTTLTGGDNYHSSLYFADQSPWTFSAWIYSPSSAPSQATENYAGSKGGTYTNIFRLNQYDNNVFGYYSQGYAPYNFQSNAAFYRKSVWFLMTWVADSSRNLSLYINGANPTTVAINNSQSVFQQFGGASSFFNGRADDVRVYNRVLSASEIKQLYLQGQVTLQPTQTSRAGSLSTGLVGYWTFNNQDMNNGAVRDMSGNNNTGNLINIATSTFYTQGKLGQAFNFDGVDDYVKVQVGAIPASPVTACAWVYPTAANGIVLRYIIDNVSDFNLSSYNSYWYLNGHTSQVASANPSVQVNAWQHVCGVNDASGNGTVYVNGVLSGGPGSIGASQASAWSVGIGVRGTLIENFFTGKIDDVRVYNRALSASEIKQLYLQGQVTLQPTQTSRAGSLSAGLVGYWTFNNQDMNNGAVRDMSGNNNTGNLMNIATSTFYTQGKLGQAFNFDGVDDYVKVNNDIVGTGAFSIAGWVYLHSYGPGSGGRIFSNYYAGMRIGPTDYGGNRLEFTNDAFASDKDGTNNTIFLNKWYFFAATRTAAGIVNLYLDGKLTGAADQNAGANQAGTGVWIGNYSGLDRPFDGKMDDVRMYNRVLSASEVKQLYLMGK